MIFIPLIMGSGGNTGNQSATLIITALTTGNVTLRDWRKILWRELRVGLMLGGLLALLGLVLAWLHDLERNRGPASSLSGRSSCR